MDTKPRKHGRLILKLSALGFGMFAFAYAMVPLYNALCDATGLNGRTGGRVRLAEINNIDTSRTVKVNFIVTNNEGMPWVFDGPNDSLEVHPGEVTRVLFHAKNPTGADMVGQTIPSIAPSESARYFKKTECFCFNKQPLKAGEAAEMPMVFFIDPTIPREIEQLTLSYTLFDITGNP
jgi:cytochrome c oxidase assembly protein subunit 11